MLHHCAKGGDIRAWRWRLTTVSSSRRWGPTRPRRSWRCPGSWPAGREWPRWSSRSPPGRCTRPRRPPGRRAGSCTSHRQPRQQPRRCALTSRTFRLSVWPADSPLRSWSEIVFIIHAALTALHCIALHQAGLAAGPGMYYTALLVRRILEF